MLIARLTGGVVCGMTVLVAPGCFPIVDPCMERCVVRVWNASEERLEVMFEAETPGRVERSKEVLSPGLDIEHPFHTVRCDRNPEIIVRRSGKHKPEAEVASVSPTKGHRRLQEAADHPYLFDLIVENETVMIVPRRE